MDKKNKKEIPIVHKSQAEIEEEVGLTWEEFIEKKEFDENSPLQFTNKVVSARLKAMGDGHPAKAYIGASTRLFQLDYNEYRRQLQIAGYKYVGEAGPLPEIEPKEDWLDKMMGYGIRGINYPGNLDQGGFSLVEVMVAAAMLAIIAMFIVKFDKSIDMFIVKFDKSIDMKNTKEELRIK